MRSNLNTKPLKILHFGEGIFISITIPRSLENWRGNKNSGKTLALVFKI